MLENLFKRTTTDELANIWISGLMYHFKELSGFMVAHREDPIWNTPEGKKMEALCASIMLTHVQGMNILGSMIEQEKAEREATGTPDPATTIEDLLNSMLGNGEKPEEGT